ncbi:MAG: hypothetical protein H6R06_3013 [Proteobacteria bacterium]|nr:hypothetical protein [Pseudomonadota bacterium]
MIHRPHALHSLAVAMTAACLASAAQAQAPAARSFVSVSPVFEEADFDEGGDFSVGGVILRAGTSTGFGEGRRIGLTLNYDYFDYSFDDPVAFGGAAPWQVVQRYGFAVPLSFALQDGWSVGVSPQMDWFRENGAKTSDALVWGATATAVKRFDDGNLLGLGLAAFSGIEESKFFPFPIVSWQLSPRWRLVNPLAAGPTGPAGLEIDYLADGGWTIGVGAAWRSTRYRLSQSGPVANGVGEISGAPVFLRVSRDFAGAYTLNLYAGVVAGGQIRIEDSNGRKLVEEDFDTSPIVGANLTLRF